MSGHGPIVRGIRQQGPDDGRFASLCGFVLNLWSCPLTYETDHVKHLFTRELPSVSWQPGNNFMLKNLMVLQGEFIVTRRVRQ